VVNSAGKAQISIPHLYFRSLLAVISSKFHNGYQLSGGERI